MHLRIVLTQTFSDNSLHFLGFLLRQCFNRCVSERDLDFVFDLSRGNILPMLDTLKMECLNRWRYEFCREYGSCSGKGSVSANGCFCRSSEPANMESSFRGGFLFKFLLMFCSIRYRIRRTSVDKSSWRNTMAAGFPPEKLSVNALTIIKGNAMPELAGNIPQSR
ncbi:unnamed protein product [Somion occarium]|uniref:Uncharacterized protein n=1 Tax=Somion occarium TaxID=3059160 RepID=A0ABP1CHD2_9APHY